MNEAVWLGNEQPVGEYPAIATVATAYRAVDDTQRQLVAENLWLKAQLEKAALKREDLQAEIANMYPLMRTAEEQNARYARELELLREYAVRCDELTEEVAVARNEGFDEGYSVARGEVA